MIFDILFLLVLILTVLICAKKGFVRSLLEVAGFVLSVLIAFSISEPIANFVYDNVIEAKVIDKIGNIAIENVGEVSGELWGNLPEFITDNASFFSIDENSVEEMIIPFVQEKGELSANVLSDSIVKPAIVGFFSSMLSFVLIIGLIFLFRFLAKLINKLFTFSIIGKLNTFLGGALGVIQGVAICILLCAVFEFLLKTLDYNFWLFTRENLLKSFIYNKFAFFK